MVLPFALVPAADAATADQAVAYQVDPQHDGYVSGAPVSAPLAKLWSTTLPGAISYPLIVNGVVYVTANVSTGSGTTLYAMDLATGATLWSHGLGGTYHWSGLAYDGGRVFTLNDTGLLSAFDAATGTSAWTKQLPGQTSFSSPPTASQGIVYAGGAGSGGTLYAVRESDGSVRWTQSVENGDHSSPAVDGSAVYVTYPGPQDYAFDRQSGAPLWHHSGASEGGGGRTPVVAAGMVFARDFISSDALLSAADGSVVGTLSAGPAPAVGGGVAYELNGGTLSAVAQDGQGSNSWQFTGDGHLDTAPLLVGGLAVVGSSSGELYALDGSGNVAWSGNVGAAIPAPDEQNVSQPLTGLAAGEGTVVVPAGGTLVAYASSGATSGTPAVQSGPSVAGVPLVGQMVAADVGTWTGVPSSYSYQWQLCNSSGAGCNDIAGAATQAYTPSPADAGQTLRVAVSATNANGSSTTVASGPSPAVANPAFANTSVPTISGNAVAGRTLSASPGSWSSNPTGYAYQWLYCDQGTCAPEPGGTTSTYVVDPSDIGYQIEVRVTATDATGATVQATSAPTAVVTTLGPSNLSSPTISGPARVGSTLVGSLGTWSGSPNAYDVQWFSCDAGLVSCSVIEGATATTYVPQAVDTGRVIALGVIAANALGDSAPAFSDPTGPVTAAPAAQPAPAPAPPIARPVAPVAGSASTLAPNGTRLLVPGPTLRSVVVYLICSTGCRVHVTVTASPAPKGLRGSLVQRTVSLSPNRKLRLVLKLTKRQNLALDRLKRVVLHVKGAFTSNGRTHNISLPFVIGN